LAPASDDAPASEPESLPDLPPALPASGSGGESLGEHANERQVASAQQMPLHVFFPQLGYAIDPDLSLATRRDQPYPEQHDTMRCAATERIIF